MLQQINIQLLDQISMRLSSIFIMTFMKGLFMIAAIYFATRMLKKLSSRYKHLLWLIVICILLVMPAIQFAAQSFDIGVIKNNELFTKNYLYNYYIYFRPDHS